MDRFAQRFIDNLFSRYEDMQREVQMEQDRNFAEFLRKRMVNCDQGRCGYITEIIDQMEKEANNAL